MARYCVSFSRDFWEVWENTPLDKLLVAVFIVDDERRKESLIEEGRQLQLGYFLHYGMHAPKELSRAANSYDAKLSISPFVGTAQDTPALNDAKEQLKAIGRL